MDWTESYGPKAQWKKLVILILNVINGSNKYLFSIAWHHVSHIIWSHFLCRGFLHVSSAGWQGPESQVEAVDTGGGVWAGRGAVLLLAGRQRPDFLMLPTFKHTLLSLGQASCPHIPLWSVMCKDCTAEDEKKKKSVNLLLNTVVTIYRKIQAAEEKVWLTARNLK